MAEKLPTASPEAEKPKEKPAPTAKPASEDDALSPTRYGDWEQNGRCIDF